jgi:hypothetical protein
MTAVGIAAHHRRASIPSIADGTPWSLQWRGFPLPAMSEAIKKAKMP